MRNLIILLITVITFASVAVAPSTKDKIEIGVQSTSLTTFPVDSPFDETRGGVGGRFTFNFNRSIAAESEVNFFPQNQLILEAAGSSIQAQFGVKIGKRFKKFGVFGKLRPGFLSVNNFFSFVPGSQGSIFPPPFTIERKAFFTTDFGGVVELYPSSRMVVRFDAGDTAIRHPARFLPLDLTGPLQLVRPAKFSHNFQLTAGVAFRLGDFPDKEPDTGPSGNTETKRFEVGAQFTSLFVDPSNSQGFLFVPRVHTEPGIGGRVTFNLTESIAFEAEGNYFTRRQFSFPEGGRMFQGQFGAKIGKRFDRWGVFGKARPGFVGFSQVRQDPFGVPFPPLPFVRRFYPSLDLGGVMEFYVSPRWMARFDVGDTIIRYGEIHFAGLPPSFTVPSVTRHNLQLSSGVGFRF